MLVTDSGMLKVADFGTSRFLEIAAHGTTVIGSPPYMAPEQFQGKAVFASDIYSLGVTMYQMLTGVLPYNTPAPADLDELMRGELVSPPRLQEPEDPESDQRHRDARRSRRRSPRATSGPAICWTTCWPRAAAPRRGAPRRRRCTPPRAPASDAPDIQPELRARETPAAAFCWHCRKPLHARADAARFVAKRSRRHC